MSRPWNQYIKLSLWCSTCFITSFFFQVYTSFSFTLIFFLTWWFCFLSVLYSLFPFYLFLIYFFNSHELTVYCHFWSSVHLFLIMLSIWSEISAHLGLLFSSSLFRTRSSSQFFFISLGRSWEKETILTVQKQLHTLVTSMNVIAAFRTHPYGRIDII